MLHRLCQLSESTQYLVDSRLQQSIQGRSEKRFLMKKLFRTMRHRMSWTNAKKILNANGISTSHGWDGTLTKVADSGVQVDNGKLEDALGSVDV
jgi:hypothetical protein